MNTKKLSKLITESLKENVNSIAVAETDGIHFSQLDIAFASGKKKLQTFRIIIMPYSENEL